MRSLAFSTLLLNCSLQFLLPIYSLLTRHKNPCPPNLRQDLELLNLLTDMCDEEFVLRCSLLITDEFEPLFECEFLLCELTDPFLSLFSGYSVQLFLLICRTSLYILVAIPLLIKVVVYIFPCVACL